MDLVEVCKILKILEYVIEYFKRRNDDRILPFLFPTNL